ncbi:hypothetical protein QF048_002853 [Streptomyces sp. W4I9-2]|nr:hypothetical protein [Streptomyces sp. W4I9-2]
MNRRTHPFSPRWWAKVRHGMRPDVTSSTRSVPTRQRSPIRAPLTSRPRVVKFSPNTPLASFRPPSSRSQASSSSRAKAYTAWSLPP